MAVENKPSQKEREARQASVPASSLPKGGGAIRSIGEKFSINPATGEATTSVPIATSPGRGGLDVTLGLTYGSGTGNGVFGFGWSMDLPQITRRTDRGLPQYYDAEDSDIFLLSRLEDMVPVLNADNSRFVDITSAPGYVIHRYRPRIEGFFARIERWTRVADGDVHWRSYSGNNILTVYGKDATSRIADSADPTRIFTWLVCETRDDDGNAIVYEYKPEDGTGVDTTLTHERNRGAPTDPRRAVNRYLKRIRYGNQVPLLNADGTRPQLLTDAQVQGTGWLFEVVFDYGEHDLAVPTPDDAGAWLTRVDPFSSYRSRFEVRTTRLCQRVLMFHNFPNEPGVGSSCLVRSTDFTYTPEPDPTNALQPVYSFLAAVAQAGYRRQESGYLRRSMPPVEFEYAQPIVQETVQSVDAASLENLPVGIDGPNVLQWLDLHGEGARAS